MLISLKKVFFSPSNWKENHFPCSYFSLVWMPFPFLLLNYSNWSKEAHLENKVFLLTFFHIQKGSKKIHINKGNLHLTNHFFIKKKLQTTNFIFKFFCKPPLVIWNPSQVSNHLNWKGWFKCNIELWTVCSTSNFSTLL